MSWWSSTSAPRFFLFRCVGWGRCPPTGRGVLGDAKRARPRGGGPEAHAPGLISGLRQLACRSFCSHRCGPNESGGQVHVHGWRGAFLPQEGGRPCGYLATQRCIIHFTGSGKQGTVCKEQRPFLVTEVYFSLYHVPRKRCQESKGNRNHIFRNRTHESRMACGNSGNPWAGCFRAATVFPDYDLIWSRGAPSLSPVVLLLPRTGPPYAGYS